MLFVDLLRLTVLLIGGVATALGAVTVVAANQDGDAATVIFAGAWWAVAVVLGLFLGSSSRAGESMSRALAVGADGDLPPTESPADRVSAAVADRGLRAGRRRARLAASRRWPRSAPATRS